MREIEAEDVLRPSKPKRRKENKRGEDWVKEEDNSAAVKSSNTVPVEGGSDGGSRGLRSAGSEIYKSGGPRGFY